MADFDLGALVNNPMFQSGLGLMGAANPYRNAGLLQAYQILNAQTQAQQKQKNQEALMALEQERSKLYGEQVRAAARKNDLNEQMMKQFTPMVNSIMQRYGLAGTGMPEFSGMPSPATPSPITPQTSLNPTPIPAVGGHQLPLGAMAAPGQSMSNSPSTPPAMSPTGVPQGMFSGPQDMALLGGLFSGMSGDFPNAFKGFGAAMQPTEIKPDTTYQYGGRTVVTPPSNLQQEELNLKKAGANREASAEARHQSETNQKLALAKATDFGEVKTVLDASMEMAKKATQIKTNPALERVTGVMGMFPNVPGQPAADVQADLENLKAKSLLTTITALKSLSKNGSTGFGQLSNIEGEKLENSIASLKTTQSAEKMRQNMGTVMQNINRLTDRTLDVYERTYKESPYEGLPVGTRPSRNPDGSQAMSRNGNPLLKLPNGSLMEVTP